MSRLKRTLADFFQQADLVLLGLCCAATLFGIALIISATQYLEEVRMIIRYAGVQAAGMLLGICAYIFLSVSPSVAVWNLVGWWLRRINQGILLSLVSLPESLRAAFFITWLNQSLPPAGRQLRCSAEWRTRKEEGREGEKGVWRRRSHFHIYVFLIRKIEFVL